MTNDFRKIVRPFHDLAGMMSHCEANYLLLCQILPTDRWKEHHLTTTLGQSVTFYFIEQAVYTMTIRMRVSAIKNIPLQPEAEWVIRLYHDASIAEVIADDKGRQYSSRYPYPNKSMHHPDEKFRLNEHLGEWLMRCFKKSVKHKRQIDPDETTQIKKVKRH